MSKKWEEYMGKRTTRHYTLEFKQQAVDLGNRIGMQRAADQLGVHVSNIHAWKANKKKEKRNPESTLNLAEENRRLQKENDELKKVNQILKRAAAFFSQDHLK
jgi:transposase